MTNSKDKLTNTFSGQTKNAQHLNHLDLNVEVLLDDEQPEEEIVLYDEKPTEEEVIENHDEPEFTVLVEGDSGLEDSDELVLELPNIPGAPEEAQFLEEREEEEEEQEDKKELNPDEWSVDTLPQFPHWVSKKLSEVPKHSGKSVPGLRRAISYLEELKSEIEKAMRADKKGVINESLISKVYEDVCNGIDRMEERIEKIKPTKAKKKKKADEEHDLVKNAQMTPRVSGIVVTVPLLISRVARICINSNVSAGHDMNDTFKKLVKAYNLDKREQAETMQLIQDLGYPVLQDRGLLDGELEAESSDNFDFAANYPA